MKVIQKPGLYIFLIAVMALILTLFLSEFTYLPEFTDQLSLKDGQKELLKEKLQTIAGESLKKHTYIHTIGKAIDEINTEMRNQQFWDNVIYYRIWYCYRPSRRDSYRWVWFNPIRIFRFIRSYHNRINYSWLYFRYYFRNKGT